MNVTRAGMEDAGTIFEGVMALLRDMDDDTLETVAAARDRILAAWRARPDAMHAFVARDDDGAVLGIATVTEAFAIYACGSFGIVSELYVSPAARSRGVGAVLLEAANAFGATRGWSRLELTAGEGQERERRMHFYERAGFVRVGVRFKRLV